MCVLAVTAMLAAHRSGWYDLFTELERLHHCTIFLHLLPAAGSFLTQHSARLSIGGMFQL